jgi:hypothetical protein
MANHVSRFLWVVGTLVMLAACSSTSTDSKTSTAGMNATAGSSPLAEASGGTNAASAGGDAAGGATPGANSLLGAWQFTSQNPTLAIVVKFKSDGSYESNVVTFPAANFWQDQIELGSYSVSNTTLTVTPAQWSCSGPDPVSTSMFSFSNGNLALTNAKGAIVYSPQPSADQGVPANVVVTLGCYDSNGGFKAMPLSPVEN